MRQQVVMLLLLVALASPTIAASSGQPGGPPQQFYLKLDPALVVNIEDGEVVRFLQVDTQLQFAAQESQPLIEKHLPAIRHEMVMLLSGQPAAEIKTAEGKEKLRNSALEAVQKVMQENTGEPVVDALYFTTFVIQ